MSGGAAMYVLTSRAVGYENCAVCSAPGDMPAADRDGKSVALCDGCARDFAAVSKTARWARKDRYQGGQGCLYCSRHGSECSIAICDACGSPQCHGNGGCRGQCSICYVGLLPGWSGHDRPCSRKGCTNRAVADAPRAGNVCAGHAAVAVCVAATRGKERQTVAEYVERRLSERTKQWELIEIGAAAA